MELPSTQDYEAFLSQRQVRMGNLVSRIQQPQLIKELAEGKSQNNLVAIKQDMTAVNSENLRSKKPRISNYNSNSSLARICL